MYIIILLTLLLRHPQTLDLLLLQRQMLRLDLRLLQRQLMLDLRPLRRQMLNHHRYLHHLASQVIRRPMHAVGIITIGIGLLPHLCTFPSS